MSRSDHQGAGGPAESRAQAVSSFFSWWKAARPRVEAALSAGGLGALEEEISRNVERLAPGLGWEIGPGIAGGAYALSLSWGDDLDARRVTELWRRAAPAALDGWELYPAKPGGADLATVSLEIEGERVDFAAMELDTDEDEARERLDVRVFHPSFARLPAELAEQLAELALVLSIGEDARARWLGDREAVRARPRAARPLSTLRGALEALAARATGERFTVLEGESDGRPAFALVNLACKPVDHLALDRHLRVELALAAARDDGLPTEDEQKALESIEEDLRSAFEELEDASAGAATNEAAILFAQETGGGRRVLHFYVASAAEARVRAAVEEWRSVHGDDRAIAATWSADPGWGALARFG
jgi:hypothetical protein